MLRFVLYGVAVTCVTVAGLDNGVGLTPAMGYNTWDDFRCGGVNESNIRKVVNSFKKYGLDKVGYQYVGIDDCWAVSRDKTTGTIIEDPKAFPNGMKAVADYVHSKGLKFGIYTDRGTATCVGRPGSQGYEKNDANTYAKWGVDLVKEDSCNAPDDHSKSFEQYGLMRDALNATGRPIYFALCGWSSWYAPVGKTLGNSWRYGYDVNDWGSAWTNAITAYGNLSQYAGIGGWNDPDALIGSSEGTAVHLTQKQSRAQMSLWSTMAAPLEIGSNILNLSDYDLETYKNTEVIAVDQDPLGIPGNMKYDSCGNANIADPLAPFKSQIRGATNRKAARMAQAFGNDADVAVAAGLGGSCTVVPNCKQIWTKELSDGYAVTFLNFTRSQPLSAQSSSTPATRTADGTPRKELIPTAASATARMPSKLGGDGIGNGLRMLACNRSDATQQWSVTTQGGGGGDPAMSVIKSAAGNEACWEVDGCNYMHGTKVDTAFGCKPLPPRGLVDPCCSNMAFSFNKNGTITTSYAGMCFQVTGLARCNGSPAQQWLLGALTANKTQQIIQKSGVRGGGTQQCIGRTVSTAAGEDTGAGLVTQATNTAAAAAGGGGDGGLVFDVKKELGWESAMVRDLWAHKNLGMMKVITLQLEGDGDAAMYKLTKAKATQD